MNITRITSKENPLLKKIRRSGRGDSAVLIEGAKLIREALAGGFRLTDVIVADASVAEHDAVLHQCQQNGARLASVTTAVLASVSDAVTSQGIVALTTPHALALEDLEMSRESILVVCDAIQDPGNLGAIVRSAFAFGATAALLLPGCANPFGAKAVRGSAGACFKLPVIRTGFNELLRFFTKAGVTPYALDAEGGMPLDAAEFAGSCAIIVGNEGAGINPILKAVVRNHVRIPLDARMESLNAAVSAAVTLYEMARRQRRG